MRPQLPFSAVDDDEVQDRPSTFRMSSRNGPYMTLSRHWPARKYSPRCTPSRRKSTRSSALLRKVVHFGSGLQAVRRGPAEQILDELTLGFYPNAMPSVFREQRDPDLEGPGRTDCTPGHPARTRTVLEPDGEEGRVLPGEAVITPAPLDLPDGAHAEPEPLVLAWCRRAPQKTGQVGELVFLDGRSCTPPLTPRVSLMQPSQIAPVRGVVLPRPDQISMM